MTHCTCPSDAGDLLRVRLSGTAEPCPTHDPHHDAEPGAPMALNDFDALTNSILSRLGADLAHADSITNTNTI